jgi:hypothetical protein
MASAFNPALRTGVEAGIPRFRVCANAPSGNDVLK